MATNPTLLTQPIAANGAKNVIPNTTATVGAMSQDQGFPAETALPLGAGGVAPSREDFNGAFNLLSGILYMAQKGWVFLFDENQDYFAGCTVRDPLDSKIYEAINDVPASSTHPSADSLNWKESGTDMSAYTTTINSSMFNKRDIITTSGTYTAPVTGWYKITAKGGGGGGGGGGSQSGINSGGAGGGEGGTIIAYERMTVGDTATVTIGAGGTGAPGNGNSGNDGGDSSFTVNGNTYTAGGGKGGTTNLLKNLGGAGGTGDIYGGAGGTGSIGTAAMPGTNGGGAGGGKGGTNGVGGGGGGGAETNYAAGDGGDGYAWIEYFDSSLNP